MRLLHKRKEAGKFKTVGCGAESERDGYILHQAVRKGVETWRLSWNRRSKQNELTFNWR